ncbi:hypothetical protein AB2B38_013595 [Balneola sp. MJW-20]|uniref:hypothetical protein n=1 Tax=Gracilimonas aurantiaca TaxID=3234185 RepID=UPI0034661806
MKSLKILCSILLLSIFAAPKIIAQISIEDQIKIAVLAAPEEYRADATVFGYNDDGLLYKIKEGNNQFYCIADNQKDPAFQVSCYHESLELFMKRGRELRAEGKTPQEIFDIREEEAKKGSLQMPAKPATMNIYFGTDVSYNAEKGIMDGAQFRYVIYVPFETQESTGLPLKPNGQGHPWLMDAGTHKAHIMIIPKAN